MDQGGFPLRVKLGFVASCYLAVLAFATVAIIGRHFAALRDPNDFNGGMAAAGDLFLELGIGFLLLIPTILLALVIRENEAAYTTFAKVLFAFSLTAPISLALSLIPIVSQTDNLLGWVCNYRLFATPMVLLWLATGRWFARFKLAKRLTFWALMIETATPVLMVALLAISAKMLAG